MSYVLPIYSIDLGFKWKYSGKVLLDKNKQLHREIVVKGKEERKEILDVEDISPFLLEECALKII